MEDWLVTSQKLGPGKPWPEEYRHARRTFVIYPGCEWMYSESFREICMNTQMIHTNVTDPPRPAAGTPTPDAAELPLDLEAIETRWQKSTQGRWHNNAYFGDEPGNRHGHWIEAVEGAPGETPRADWPMVAPTDAVCWEDAEFMAQAHQDVPALCQEVRRLRAILERRRIDPKTGLTIPTDGAYAKDGPADDPYNPVRYGYQGGDGHG